MGAQASLPHASVFLQTPSQTADVDMRGPSARFRAPSPAPPSESGPGVEVTGMMPPGSISTNPRGQQSLGSGLASVSEDQIFGQSRMSDHCGPRLIVFLVGGATWPETRVCYSVTQRVISTLFSYTKWLEYIGSQITRT